MSEMCIITIMVKLTNKLNITVMKTKGDFIQVCECSLSFFVSNIVCSGANAFRHYWITFDVTKEFKYRKLWRIVGFMEDFDQDTHKTTPLMVCCSSDDVYTVFSVRLFGYRLIDVYENE